MNKPKVVTKPWGREIWFAYGNNKYVGKILEVNKGHRMSMQYHKKKEETFLIDSGKARITYGKYGGKLQTKIFTIGQILHLVPKTVHRLEAVENTRIIEVSTDHLTDVIRISDDYGREGKGK